MPTEELGRNCSVHCFPCYTGQLLYSEYRRIAADLTVCTVVTRFRLLMNADGITVYLGIHVVLAGFYILMSAQGSQFTFLAARARFCLLVNMY